MQHYQKDADGLCCRLKHSIDKTKDVEFVVSMSDFKDSTLLHCDVNSIFDGVAYIHCSPLYDNLMVTMCQVSVFNLFCVSLVL